MNEDHPGLRVQSTTSSICKSSICKYDMCVTHDVGAVGEPAIRARGGDRARSVREGGRRELLGQALVPLARSLGRPPFPNWARRGHDEPRPNEGQTLGKI